MSPQSLCPCNYNVKIWRKKYVKLSALVWTHLWTTNFPAGNGCPAHGPSSEQDFVKTSKKLDQEANNSYKNNLIIIIIIKNKKEKTCTLIDVAIPADRNVVQKEAEKKLK
jgi:hypothetical protein